MLKCRNFKFSLKLQESKKKNTKKNKKKKKTQSIIKIAKSLQRNYINTWLKLNIFRLLNTINKAKSESLIPISESNCWFEL
jgi:hypothetical protein